MKQTHVHNLLLPTWEQYPKSKAFMPNALIRWRAYILAISMFSWFSWFDLVFPFANMSAVLEYQGNRVGICFRVVGVFSWAQKDWLQEMLLYSWGLMFFFYLCHDSYYRRRKKNHDSRLSERVNYFIGCLFADRGENGELRVGVRRAMRQHGNVPSSVISSHSMHLGVLATAWHAISTGTMFTVYYKPRYCLWSISVSCMFSFVITSFKAKA